MSWVEGSNAANVARSTFLQPFAWSVETLWTLERRSRKGGLRGNASQIFGKGTPTMGPEPFQTRRRHAPNQR